MITRIKSEASVVAAAEAYRLRMNEDALEKQALLVELQELVEKNGRVDTVRVDLDNEPFQLRSGSSLHHVHTPAKVLLQEMCDFKSMIFVYRHYNISDADEFCINARGEVWVYVKHGKHDISQWLDVDPNAIERIRLLTELAKVTGAFVWDSDEVVMSQWLRFHELNVPATIGEINNLITFLSLELPAADTLGNYWSQLVADNEASVVLTDEEIKRIRALTATTVPAKGRLLEKLYGDSGKALPVQGERHTANRLIGELLSHSASQLIAKKYLGGLHWYGAGPDENVTAEDLAQLLVTAILLDLDRYSGRDPRRNHICGYDLYRPQHVDLPHFIILEDLERYLLSNERVTAALAPLATHLLLAKTAPEFLVKDIPVSLRVGSTAWVSFCRTVAVIELRAPGSSRLMTHDQVMAFAVIEPVSQSMEQLQGLVAIQSIIDWGLINEVITHEQLNESEKEASIIALTAYERHATLIAQAAEAFSTAIPTRKQLALEALKEVAPECDLEEETLYTRNDRRNKGGSNWLNGSPFPDEQPDTWFRPWFRPMSMVDAHISGYLVGGNWDRLDGESIFKTWPRLAVLETVDDQFDVALRAHHGNMNKAHITVLKLAMSKMTGADRVIFQNNKVGIFTLRPSVAKNHIPEVTSGQLGTSTPGKNYMAETQAEKDAATGRYGVVLCAFHGNNQITCYEIFTLHGECHKNDALGALIGRIQRMHTGSRVDFSGDMSKKVPAIPVTTDIPVDLRKYTHGVKTNINTQSTAVIEKLGEIAAPAIPVERKRSIYSNFECVQFDKIATFIVEKRPLVTCEELKEIATELTWLERVITAQEKQAEFLINLIVPFKSCMEDIASGEKSRVADGVFGCIMDAIALLGTVVGIVGKVMSVTARSVSMASKVASLAKFAISTTVSMLNPLDGLGTLGNSTVKLLHKGGLRLGRRGLQTVETATFQLRKIAGKAQSYDLIKAADYPQIGQGLWRPLENGGDALNIYAIRKKEHWFATNRLGRPWGPKLQNFAFNHPLRLPRLRRVLPSIYTRHILQKCVPIARTRVDNALMALGGIHHNLDTNLAIGLLFGSTAGGRDRMLTFLKVVKTDFDGVSGRNFVLAAAKDDVSTASLMPEDYKAWKEAGPLAGQDQPVITVYCENINDHFYAEKLKHEVIANDLVREMFRGGPAATGLSYAVEPRTINPDNYQLNVAPLLNLALGELPISSQESPERKHDSTKALENADSFNLATALLSQLITDRAKFLRNTQAMSAAVGNRRGGAIDVEVLVSL